MPYEINVAKNGRHLFATTERSAMDQINAANLLAILMFKFPESEGYSIHITIREEKNMARGILAVSSSISECHSQAFDIVNDLTQAL